MFPKYPYLDLSDRNLDFLTKAIREMENEVKNFVSLNAVKYADPIQWDITRQYEKNTIVIDPINGTAYISIKAVPSGVAITRTQYWSVIFDLSRFIIRAIMNFTNHYEKETTTTATFNSNVGDWIGWGDVLYVVTNHISAGDAYIIDGNIRHFTIEDVYNDIISAIDTEISNRREADEEISGIIASEVRARADADLIIENLIASEARARVDADLSIEDLIASEARARVDADSALANDISALISGTQSKFSTTRKLIMMGDSWGLVNADHDREYPWTYHVRTNLNLESGAYYNLCGASYSFSGTYKYITLLQNYIANNDPMDIDTIVVIGGGNEQLTGNAIIEAIGEFMTYVKANCKNSVRVIIGMCQNTPDPNIKQTMRVRNSAYSSAPDYGAIFVNNISNVVHRYDTFFADDELHHINDTGSRILGRHVTNAILSGDTFPHYYPQSVPLTISSTFNEISASIFVEELQNNFVYRRINSVKFTPTNAGEYTASGIVSLGSITPKYALGTGVDSITNLFVLVNYLDENDQATNKFVPASMFVTTNQTISLYFRETVEKVNYFTIQTSYQTIPSSYC